jgi:hypothetical protein
MRTIQVHRNAEVLSVFGIRRYYENSPLNIPRCWNLSRKHVRIVLPSGWFLKLNKCRVSQRRLRNLLVKYAPFHVYFGVLDWLFPERVGKRYKANRAVPIGGEYIFDVDCHNVWSPHPHVKGRVCPGCITNSKGLTIHICEAIEQNYSNIQIVFSGRRGFHIHVLDFNLRDWTYYDERNPIKSHKIARFKYSRILAKQCYGFNRPHFVVACDPMRLVTVPSTLNAKGRLICVPVGDKKALEDLDVQDLLERANPFPYMGEFLSATDLVHAHPELYDLRSKVG